MDAVEAVRRFNRTYTQRIGALEDSFLGLGLPLSLARLVFEIAQRSESAEGDGVTVLGLRQALGLDSGYVARQLRALEDRGLVEVAPDATDRRRRIARLTEHGTALAARLDHRSQELASNLLAPLTGRQQERLLEALSTADLLVRAATVEIEDVDPRSPRARTAVAAYFAELDARFPEGFDVAAAEADDLADPDLHEVRFLVASSDGVPVACGGVRDLAESLGPGIGEIKRMWVHEDWRGAGLGSRLLRHLEDLARSMGRREVRLDTNRALGEALEMYRRAGYREIERYNDNPYAQAFFAKTLEVH